MHTLVSIWNFVLLVAAWCYAHPWIWPVLTAILTSIAGKPTAEEYAAMSPRWAAFRRFVAAIGLDVPKTIETLKLLASGGVPADAPKKSEGPSVPPVLVFLAFKIALGLVAIATAYSCAPAAESAYTAQQLECVDHAKTRAESRACRAAVDRDWHLVDGGIQ